MDFDGKSHFSAVEFSESSINNSLDEVAAKNLLEEYVKKILSINNKKYKNLRNLEIFTSENSEHFLKSAKRLEILYRNRDAVFGNGFFSDPIWLMLIDLTIHRIENKKLTITSLGLASGAPTSTSLRYIMKMSKYGFVNLQKDFTDSRRTYVELSESAFEKMCKIISNMAKKK